MSFIQLREYQEEALNVIAKALSDGISKQLIVLPTGSGKTILMAAIAKHLNKRTLILSHREELIQQAFEKFKLYWPEADIGICKAERDETNHQIVIGSVQSCSKSKRLASLKDSAFDVLLIDEAHHATAESYQKIIKELGFHTDQTKLLLGFTATPNRSDKDSLGETFEKVTYSRSISTMIKAGYLSPAIGRKILTNFSLQNIKVQNGDFSICELAEIVNTPERNAFIAEKYKAYAIDRKGVAFCVDVAHCKDLSASFEKVGITSKAVWSEMPTEERRNVLEDLKAGRIQVAMSCGVLTEGFDEPSISCIAMARPTKSQSLYIQCIGRGLRLWPGKQDCLVLDFTDKGHSLDSIMSLSKTMPNTLEIHESPTGEREKIEKTAKIEVIEECDMEFDLLGCAKFIWIPIGDNEWSLIDDERREIVVRPLKNGFIADIFQNGSKTSIISDPLPLEYCSGVCEDYARRHLKIAFADMSAPWMNARVQPTQSQKELLQKHKAYNDGMTKAEASIEIRRIIAMKNKQKRRMLDEPITMKQKFTLMKTGVNTNNMSKCRQCKKFQESNRWSESMAKKKKLSLEDRFFPVATIPKLNQPEKSPENPDVIKKIIQGAIQGAFQLKMPSDYDIKYKNLPKTLASDEQIQLVIHLIESLEPTNVIEAALASQFAITYIRGLKKAQGDHPNELNATIQLFEFGHQVLEALQKYRSKGAQQISVQYNVNQGQVVNIKNIKKEDPITLEGKVI